MVNWVWKEKGLNIMVRLTCIDFRDIRWNGVGSVTCNIQPPMKDAADEVVNVAVGGVGDDPVVQECLY